MEIGEPKPSKKGWIIFIVVIIVLGLIGLGIFSWYISNYNKAVTLNEAVKEKWAQVDTQLKRRYDLIPNLVETVKGYAKHEKELFTHIADVRKSYFQAGSPKEKMEKSRQLEGFISRLLLLRENYPNLKANESFLKLQDQLEGTENRIAVARKRYNDAVRDVNTYIKTYFGRYFAEKANVGKAEYFEAPKKEKEVPKVKFP